MSKRIEKQEVSKQLNLALGKLFHHEGAVEELEEKIERAARLANRSGQEGKRRYLDRAMRLIADERNLFFAMHHIRSFGGDSPGPDGMRVSYFTSKSECFDLCRALRKDLKNQVY